MIVAEGEKVIRLSFEDETKAFLVFGKIGKAHVCTPDYVSVEAGNEYLYRPFKGNNTNPKLSNNIQENQPNLFICS